MSPFQLSKIKGYSHLYIVFIGFCHGEKQRLCVYRSKKIIDFTPLCRISFFDLFKDSLRLFNAQDNLLLVQEIEPGNNSFNVLEVFLHFLVEFYLWMDKP
ncbi:MAG: hypothetical protein FD151_1826 [bacterium]|nr:MAG: hypothetical protein FD151_1826 [bacterium]